MAKKLKEEQSYLRGSLKWRGYKTGNHLKDKQFKMAMKWRAGQNIRQPLYCHSTKLQCHIAVFQAVDKFSTNFLPTTTSKGTADSEHLCRCLTTMILPSSKLTILNDQGRYSQSRHKSECKNSVRFEIQSQLRFCLKLVFINKISTESKLSAVPSYSIGHKG